MGAVLLAGGAKGKRYCLPHSRVMIHQPLGGFQGQATDIEIHAREILDTRDRLNEILAQPHRPDDRQDPHRHRPRQLHERGAGDEPTDWSTTSSRSAASCR